MSILTDERRALIKDIKSKSIEELYVMAEDFQKQIQLVKRTKTQPGDPEKCEALVDCMQIVIIMIALKKGNYEKYILNPELKSNSELA